MEDYYTTIKSYKDAPEGSSHKKIYDSVYMDIELYIKKYYLNYDASRWNKYWRDDILSKIFDETKQDELRKYFGLEGKGKFLDFDRMLVFYNEIKDDPRFEDDIKRFFAFLAGDGYFESKGIAYEEFLNARDLNHPQKTHNDLKYPTLNELSKIEGGQNYIREQLPSMGWLKM
ncbi:MAG: hypothetical protein U0Y10_01455 [Spirosomataceae bacterium]